MSTQASSWNGRLNVASAAQKKYLWVMMILGIFYWAVHVQVTSATTRVPDSFTVPVLGLQLPTLGIWESSPAVLFFVILAFFGALRAYTTAHNEIAPGDETADENPNALDWFAYTTTKSPVWVRRLLGLTYPLFVSVFAFEAALILASIVRVPIPLPGKWPLVIVGATEGIIAAWFLVRFWGGRFARFKERRAA